MKIAIMQPYFMPYIGYWQLISAVDKFVIYDNIQFTKKGWINRNRILVNGTDTLFSLPLKKDSDYLNVNERTLSNDYKKQINKTLRIIKSSYLKAPHFNIVFPILEDIFNYNETNLFHFIMNSINIIKEYLEIRTDIIISSEVTIDHNKLKGENKVLAICKELNAKEYINTIGGKVLYKKNIFNDNNIKLYFIESQKIDYKQFKNEFIQWLSIIDLMMFNSVPEIKKILRMYKLK